MPEGTQITWGAKTLSSEVVTATFCKGFEDITYQTAFDQPEIITKVIKSNFADAYGERQKNPRGMEIRKKTSSSQNLIL